ncbi:putative transcription factor interactor and regulator CCHC(Zn) family [Helianthus annuus]|uniref:Transcription factor interactor and regulator CCHC(Zn) family n=3 Tax=Helianthus annuus TaxID=4232 RepID=A0A9K3JI50_HELAN|nr:putative transcription factor interactor and regulator CCHC(Zn) family [Helianthus annuus]KAJ0936271.1 putative transcription factor interactor and regulator CCHC(Zn) family [Helianthus annuus]KAJ0944186.1 putative transcription factor interactor and regulator CCHC(Zn) family [Helianthus annuus]
MHTEVLPDFMQTVMQQMNDARSTQPPPTPSRSPTPPCFSTPPHSPHSPPKGKNVKDLITPPTVDIHKWLSRFQKQQPRSFSVAATPIEAQNWIAHIEKIFEVLGVGDEFKTRLAAYKLEDNAQTWWHTVKHARGGDTFAATLPWDSFKTLFFQQYFPVAFRDEYIREFASIKQREDEPMTEFMERFTRLASFVGPNAGSPAAQAGKFKWALCERIKWLVVNQDFKDITEVANAVQNLEIANRTMKLQYGGDILKNLALTTGQTSTQIPLTGNQKTSSNQNSPPAPQNSQAIVAQTHNQPRKPCSTCGKTHGGVCLKLTGGCFRCKQTGHAIQNCPFPPKDTEKKITTGANAIPANRGGRVFALKVHNKPTEHHGYDVIGREP